MIVLTILSPDTSWKQETMTGSDIFEEKGKKTEAKLSTKAAHGYGNSVCHF